MFYHRFLIDATGDTFLIFLVRTSAGTFSTSCCFFRSWLIHISIGNLSHVLLVVRLRGIDPVAVTHLWTADVAINALIFQDFSDTWMVNWD